MRGWTALPVVLACAAGVAQAGEKPLYVAAPGWVVPAPDPDLSRTGEDAPLILLFDQQQRIADGQVWGYTDTATRIASADMLNQAGTIRLTWQPHDGDLTVHRLEILRGAERIDQLKGGRRFEVIRREQQLERMSMDGMLTATFAVEGLRVGDVLRVAFSITEREDTLGGGAQSVVGLLAEPIRVGFGRVRVSWPRGSAVRWKPLVDAAKPAAIRNGGDDGIELRLPIAKPEEMPDDAPLRFRRPPLLEMSTFADWQAVSRVQAPLYATAGLIADGGALAGEVAKIKAGSPDPVARAAAALRLVQDEVRYLYNGMAGGNYRPQPPAQTWAVRYGDCKAKTLLLLALLHALDIQAEAVLVSSGGGDLVPLRLAAPMAFDHVVVRAEVAGRTLWMDGTTTGTRAEDLNDVPPFRHVLPLRSTGAALLAIPTRAASRPEISFSAEIDQSAGLTLPAPYKATMIVRGGDGQGMEVAAQQADADAQTGMVQQTLGRFMDLGAITRRSFRYDKQSGLATITAEGIATTGWQREDQRYRLTLDRVVGEAGFEPDRARTAWREIPAAAAGPMHMQVTTRIRLPAGGRDFALDGDRSFDAPLAGARVARQVALSGEWLTLKDRVTADGGEIAPGDIAASRAGVALAKTRLLTALAPATHPARWQEVETARRAKRLDPIEAAYAADIAANPKETRPLINRALFRGNVFDHAGALADADQVIAIEPSVANRVWRAGLLRTLGQDARALADLEAARALEPESNEVAQAMAELKGEQGRTDEALALIEPRIARGGKPRDEWRARKADVLAHGKRPAEAIAAIDAAIAGSPGNPDLLNRRCWLKGQLNTALDTALKDCTKSIELAELPADALDSRALIYFRMNRMDDALADLDAALALSPGEPGSLYLRGLVRKRQGANGDADIAAARMQSPRIAENYGRFGIVP